MSLQWNTRETMTDVRAEVKSILETSGEVVKVAARNNLLKIRDPEFGMKYRKLLALYRLQTNLVETDKFIEIQVGLPKGKKGDRYGWYIEMGSQVAAAHPWLRPALLNNLKNIKALFNQT